MTEIEIVKQAIRCIVGACDETCKGYDAKKSVCHGYGEVASGLESILKEYEQYRAIGTVEEFKALKEKLENAKEDIRKLLSSEYGSSCQFCVHDENEDAICCNIGGSGSWCCENARWKEY